MEKLINTDGTEEKDPDYKKGFNVLMQYWEDLPDDVKVEADATLKELGL